MFDAHMSDAAMLAAAGGNAAVSALSHGLPVFFVHVLVTLALLLAAALAYAALTPHKELELIRAGNSAAAVSYAGAIIGLALPLSVCMATSFTWLDIALWGVVTTLLQLIAFRFVDRMLKDLPQRIVDGEMAAAVLLVGVKFAVSMVLAAAVSGAPLALA